jgi:hypothetical protein
MVGPFTGVPYSYGALRQTFGPLFVRCDVCRRYARLSLVKNPFGHEIGVPMKAMVDDVSVIEESAALLRRRLPAWVLSAPASERRNSGPRRRPTLRLRCRFSRRKQFRLRDARIDGEGRRPVGRQQQYLQRVAV